MKIFWRGATFVYVILLTAMSLLPGKDSTGQDTVAQAVHNVLHFPAYFIFAYLLIQSIRKINSNVVFWVFIVCVSYGILMEVGQSFVPNRYISLGDVLVNASGALLTVILAHKNIVKII